MKDSRGFTLIELLTVVTIIGLLVAIALPKYTGNKERAQIAAMKSDLRNLAAAQENYFVESLTYTTSITALDMTQTPEVTLTIPLAQVTGFRATAAHASVVGTTCEIYFGSAGGATIATTEGLVTCG